MIAIGIIISAIIESIIMAALAIGAFGLFIVAWNVYWWRSHSRRRERAGLKRKP